jgi:thioredoxin-like negative regulator of GroEL
MPSPTTFTLISAGLVAAAVTGVRLLTVAPEAVAVAPADRAVMATVTSREGLAAAIATLSRRVAVNPSDEHAAVSLADALVRQARVTGDATLPKRRKCSRR